MNYHKLLPKIIGVATAMLLFMVGCGARTTPPTSTQVASPVTNADANILQPTATLMLTQPPTETQPPIPDPTLNVTETPDFNSFARSNVEVQERGGVLVEIAWVLIGDKQILEQDKFEGIIIDSNKFADKPVVAWIVFSITNNSGKDIHLHPRRGSVIINDERIDLSEYKSYTSVDEKFDGSYSPGERVSGGGVWFGIQYSAVSEIKQMTVTMHGPHFPEEDYYAEDYHFVLDLSNHVYEEIPVYLK